MWWKRNGQRPAAFLPGWFASRRPLRRAVHGHLCCAWRTKTEFGACPLLPKGFQKMRQKGVIADPGVLDALVFERDGDDRDVRFRSNKKHPRLEQVQVGRSTGRPSGYTSMERPFSTLSRMSSRVLRRLSGLLRSTNTTLITVQPKPTIGHLRTSCFATKVVGQKEAQAPHQYKNDDCTSSILVLSAIRFPAPL